MFVSAGEKDCYLYKRIFEQSREAIVISGSDGRIIDANQAAARFLGFSYPSQLLHSHTTDFYANPLIREVLHQELEKYGFIEDHEVEFIKQDGTGNHIVALLSAIRVKNESGHTIRTEAFFSDITFRKSAEKAIIRSEQRLRDLAMSFEATLENERRKIAADLHDVLGQQLTAINLDVAWLKDHSGHNQKEVNDHIDRIASMIQECIKSVQHISSDLRPRFLDDMDLIEAIEWNLSDLRIRTGITCKTRFEPEHLSLSSQAGTQIYRICQEALTNVVRHAKASIIELSMVLENDLIKISVRDNGIGIQESKISESKALGITGMRERVRSLDGHFSITGKKDHGTEITVLIPYNKCHD